MHNHKLYNYANESNKMLNTICRHVYRENNQEADLASKAGLNLALGIWKVAETRDGTTQEYYHRPFIDLI